MYKSDRSRGFVNKGRLRLGNQGMHEFRFEYAYISQSARGGMCRNKRYQHFQDSRHPQKSFDPQKPFELE